MSEYFLQIEKLLSAVGDAEYRYLLIEPLIFYGLFVGVILLAVGFFMKALKLQRAALIVIGVAAFGYFPYKDARLSAQPRMEQVYKISSPARVKGFAENTREWVATSWQFRLLILCVVTTFLIGINRNKIGFAFAIASMLLALLTAKNAIWLNYQDAIAYHPNLQLHESPIDQDSVSAPPPLVVRKEEIRRPAPAVTQPIRPATRVRPPTASVPMPTPSPASERITAPTPPPSALAPRERRVLPLFRD